MLLNRDHRPWAWFTLLASAAAVGLYLLVFHPGTLPVRVTLPDWLAPRHRLHRSVGNSPLGLAYGIISYAIFVFAVLLNVRKKFPLLRVGRAQTWLRAHIWLTVLTLPLVFLHAAFHFGGAMTSTLMWLYLLVMVSGFYGLALQQFMPRLMKARLSLETIFEQIPYLTQQLLAAALKMRDEMRPAAPAAAPATTIKPTLAGAPAEVVTAPAPHDLSAAAMLDALERQALPYLAARKAGPHPLGREQEAREFFRQLKLRVAPEQHERVAQLASWCEERRQMDLQTRYHHWLHGWLFVHVPASFLLIVLTGWHAVAEVFLY